MDQEKIIKSIKENKGILRQLTDLNKRVKRLEQKDTYYPYTKEKIANIKVGGTDPD